MADKFLVTAIERTRKFRATHESPYGKRLRGARATVQPEKLDGFERGMMWKAQRGYEYLIDTIQCFEIMNPGYLAFLCNIPKGRSEEARLHWLAWGRNAENYEMPPFSIWPWDSLNKWLVQAETIEFLASLRVVEFATI